MSEQDTFRAELISDLRKAGLRLDDASTAAELSARKFRRKRDELIRDCYRAGLSLRHLAKRLGMSKSQVQRVVSPDSSDNGTPINSTLPPAA